VTSFGAKRAACIAVLFPAISRLCFMMSILNGNYKRKKLEINISLHITANSHTRATSSIGILFSTSAFKV